MNKCVFPNFRRIQWDNTVFVYYRICGEFYTPRFAKLVQCGLMIYVYDVCDTIFGLSKDAGSCSGDSSKPKWFSSMPTFVAQRANWCITEPVGGLMAWHFIITFSCHALPMILPRERCYYWPPVWIIGEQRTTSPARVVAWVKKLLAAVCRQILTERPDIDWSMLNTDKKKRKREDRTHSRENRGCCNYASNQLF